jgi:succinate dehydrogenase/fumarate reductase cytochrome b subunit
MHWAVVLILAWFTGIFGLIWFFIQAGYVKKIDPASRARKFLIFGLLAMLAVTVAIFVSAGAAAMGSTESGAAVGFLAVILVIASMVFWFSAIFGMRRSLIDYFNTVEPIGLRLSGAMTFFFNILYFQYHLSRIAEWKRTGTLR